MMFWTVLAFSTFLAVVASQSVPTVSVPATTTTTTTPRPTPPPMDLPHVADTCPSPECNIPLNRGFLFPSRHLRFFYMCIPVAGGTTWTFNINECPCGTLFSYAWQRCVHPLDFIPHCRPDLGGDVTVIPC